MPVLTGVTGRILGRIVNRNGQVSAPLNVMGNPIPYFPADLRDTRGRRADGSTPRRRSNGVVTLDSATAARCRRPTGSYCGVGTSSNWNTPAPVTTLPVGVCLKDGFDPTKLYQLEYTVQDPYVLGAGHRRVPRRAVVLPLCDGRRSRHAQSARRRDHLGDHARRLAVGQLHAPPHLPRHEPGRGAAASCTTARGRSSPGAASPTIRAGASPTACSSSTRWAARVPSGGMSCPTPCAISASAASSTAARVTNTCPKIIETFGGAEVFALKMTTSWVGHGPEDRHSAARQRAPLLPAELHARRRQRRHDASAARRDDGAGQLPGQQLGPRHAARRTRCPRPRS